MIRTLPVDPARLGLVATGHVTAVQVWAELADGSRRPVPGQQQKNDDQVPLWTVAGMVASAERPEVIEIQVASFDEPKVQQFAPLAVEGLEVRVTKKRDGTIAQYWAATGVGAHSAPARKDS